jgi:hypothetical protein
MSKKLPKPNKSGNLRGTNSHSHGNNNKGGKVKRNFSVRPETLTRSLKLGSSASDGLDKGIDKLFSMLPVFQKAKLAIELLIAKHPKAEEYAKTVLLELEDLEIEALYKECKTEGLIESQSGAWII